MITKHVGGCIVNRSPDEMHGNDCDCFKIEFVACAFGSVYRVQMCREWVRYMAEREDWPTCHYSYRTRLVVERFVEDALGVRDEWLRWHYTSSARLGKKQMEVAGDYGTLPMYFPEVVMDNRYGRIMQMIPCNVAATWERPWQGYPTDRINWTGWAKGYRDVIQVNADKYRKFMHALQRACQRQEACKLTGLDDRKLLVAMTELLKLKTAEHDPDEQQVSVALSV